MQAIDYLKNWQAELLEISRPTQYEREILEQLHDRILSIGECKIMFNIINDAHVILRSRGVFRQAQVFSYNGGLYAKWGGGFIYMIKHAKGTSVPTVSWDSPTGFEFKFDAVGRMVIPE